MYNTELLYNYILYIIHEYTVYTHTYIYPSLYLSDPEPVCEIRHPLQLTWVGKGVACMAVSSSA